jgi:hypothetical protein
MRAPLAPHKEQDGWLYVRVLRVGRWPLSGKRRVLNPDSRVCGEYSDKHPASRIISSRRVEEAVEMADYLKRCAEAELNATYFNSYPNGRGKWCVFSASLDKWQVGDDHVWGDTLREAYWRYKNAVQR